MYSDFFVYNNLCTIQVFPMLIATIFVAMGNFIMNFRFQDRAVANSNRILFIFLTFIKYNFLWVQIQVKFLQFNRLFDEVSKCINQFPP